MPSGLTADIYEGKDVSFRKYALRCFTQFGAGYRASDYGEKELPIDKAPVMVVSDYYYKRVKQAEEEVKKWEAVKNDPVELQLQYDNEMARRRADNDNIPKAYEIVKQRYLDMLEKAKNWKVAKSYEPLKNLMIRQLNESIEYDCSDRGLPIWTSFPPIDEWIIQKIEGAKDHLEASKDALAKAKNMVAKDNRELKKLYKALDEYDPLKK